MQVKELCQEAKKVLKSLDVTNQIQIIKDMVEKVIIYANREVESWVCLPLNHLKLGYETEDRNSGSSQRR